MKPITEPSAPLRPISDPNELQEQISRRAYELFEARGREHGHDREDWLQAEAEIIGSQGIELRIPQPETRNSIRESEPTFETAVTAA